MTATYEKVATTTISTAGTSVLVMDSIPGTYTDLVLIINGSAAASLQVRMRLNGSSSNLYSSTVLGGNGTSASGARTSSGAVTALPIDYFSTFTSTSGGGISIINLMNYSNTTTRKVVQFRANTQGSGVTTGVGNFNSTSAITRIDIISVTATNMSVGTTFTLYGIKAE